MVYIQTEAGAGLSTPCVPATTNCWERNRLQAVICAHARIVYDRHFGSYFGLLKTSECSGR